MVFLTFTFEREVPPCSVILYLYCHNNQVALNVIYSVITHYYTKVKSVQKKGSSLAFINCALYYCPVHCATSTTTMTHGCSPAGCVIVSGAAAAVVKVVPPYPQIKK